MEEELETFKFKVSLLEDKIAIEEESSKNLIFALENDNLSLRSAVEKSQKDCEVKL